MQPAEVRAAQTCRQRIDTPRAAKHVTKRDMKQRWCAGAKTLVQALRQKKPSSAAAPSQVAAPSQGKPDKNKLSKKSLMLHEAVMSAQVSASTWSPSLAWQG